MQDNVPHLTGAGDVIIDACSQEVGEPMPAAKQAESKRYTIGTISGIAGAIWDRPCLRLGLYDDLFGRVVSCYLSEDQAELARQVWRSRVRVVGMIFRDPETGRPIEIRQVKSIELAESAPPDSYKLAKGVLGWQEGDETSNLTRDQPGQQKVARCRLAPPTRLFTRECSQL